MADPRFDHDKAARIVAEAVAIGDKAACAKHHIALRTLQSYRKRLESDPQLAQACADKKAIVEADWAARLPGALAACVDWIHDNLPKLKAKPESLHAVAGAMKLLADTGLQKQLLDVRLARATGPAGAANGSPAGSGGNVVALRPAARAPTDGVHPGGEQKVSEPGASSTAR